jgi:hypothetical protein
MTPEEIKKKVLKEMNAPEKTTDDTWYFVEKAIDLTIRLMQEEQEKENCIVHNKSHAWCDDCCQEFVNESRESERQKLKAELSEKICEVCCKPVKNSTLICSNCQQFMLDGFHDEIRETIIKSFLEKLDKIVDEWNYMRDVDYDNFQIKRFRKDDIMELKQKFREVVEK